MTVVVWSLPLKNTPKAAGTCWIHACLVGFSEMHASDRIGRSFYPHFFFGSSGVVGPLKPRGNEASIVVISS